MDDNKYRDPATLFPEEIADGQRPDEVALKSAEAMVKSAFDNGEPVFVLRAKDVFALPTIANYLNRVRNFGPTNPEFERQIELIFQSFRSWQENNLNQVRYPD